MLAKALALALALAPVLVLVLVLVVVLVLRLIFYRLEHSRSGGPTGAMPVLFMVTRSLAILTLSESFAESSSDLMPKRTTIRSYHSAP